LQALGLRVDLLGVKTNENIQLEETKKD